MEASRGRRRLVAGMDAWRECHLAYLSASDGGARERDKEGKVDHGTEPKGVAMSSGATVDWGIGGGAPRSSALERGQERRRPGKLANEAC